MSSQETAGGRSSWSQTLTRPESWRGTGARLAEAAVVVAALASLVVYVAPTLDAPLLEKHAFRQTQTGFTAREFHEGGLDLLHPKLPVFGEPFEVPFEFPLFQALATIPMKLGVAEDTALRATSLACFLLTALLLYGLVRYVAGPVSGVAALVAFTLTPLAVVWSRTSMIEYLATAGAVGFAWALILWRERRQHVFFVLALVAGLVGLLVKPTTALFWIIPGLAYRPTTREGARRRRFDPLTMVAIGVPLAALALWTRHADRIKAASPITEWLTSGNLRRWNHGWVRQRLDGDMWWLILERLPTVVGLFGILLLPAIVAGVRSRQRWFWLGIVSAAVLPPLVFMNLYVHHDYYLVGVSPALAALVGLGAGWLWSIVRPGFRIVAVPLAMLILAWGTLEFGRGYWLRIHGGYDDLQALPFAHEIQRHTRADDLVAIVGLDWSPAVLYYAHRRGHMVVEHTSEPALDLIHRDGYRYLLEEDPAHDDLTFLARWSWVGALGPHLYALGDSASELPPARFVATDPTGALAVRLAAARTMSGAPRSLSCGAPTRIPAGRRGTWIRFPEAASEPRLFIDGELAPLPVRGAVFVAPRLTERGTITLTCTGAATLDVAKVVDAGPSG